MSWAVAAKAPGGAIAGKGGKRGAGGARGAGSSRAHRSLERIVGAPGVRCVRVRFGVIRCQDGARHARGREVALAGASEPLAVALVDVTRAHFDTTLTRLESRLAWRLVTAGVAIGGPGERQW